jgi:acetylornithine/N-succinyldiaminopimelate aminotransferase
MISPILPLYERADIDFTHGKGMCLYSKEGKEYLDMASGYAALSLGHCHPRMVETLKNQAEKLWHLSNRYKIPGMYEYCKKLTDVSFADTVFLANSGAEAVECMMKMARRHFNAKGKKNKFRIIVAEGAFHGRTLACATAGGQPKIKGFEPPVEGFDIVPFNDFEALRKAVTKDTAGIMLEPIQGEGGMRAHSKEYIHNVRRLCDDKGILLMFDEVQCGMGRTGHLFAYEYYDVKPDIIALGKGIGSGYPLSACLATEEVGKSMFEGSHGSTFGGNPIAVALGRVVLDELLSAGFLDHVNSVSKYLKSKLETLAHQYPEMIEEVTGVGLMTGVKLKTKYCVDSFSDLCRDNCLLSIPASGNVMRITPPLILEEKHVDEAIGKFEKSLKKLNSPITKAKEKVGGVIKKLKSKVGLAPKSIE